MAGTLGREVISTRQRKIAELAQREPALTTLAHHVDDVWMREAYRRVAARTRRRDVDGRGAARLAAVLAGESPVGAILSLAP